MSYPGPASFEDAPGWGAPSPNATDIVKDALRKELVLKEIALGQDDLRALLSRVKSVEADVEKLTSGNAMLKMYIDNLTLQMTKRR